MDNIKVEGSDSGQMPFEFNQEDDNEKTRQGKLMEQITRKATTTYVWLVLHPSIMIPT